MSMVSPEIAHQLMEEIQRVENGTDLKRVAVISRAGMKIATGESDQMDADAETASSAALVDLADKLSDSVNHGNLRELLVKAESGFVILQFINEEYMVFGGISDILRIGFYMEYLRNEAHKFAYILAGNKVTEELRKEIELQRDRDAIIKQEAKKSLAADFKMDVSQEQDMNAMQDVLSFLKDWGEEESEIAPSADNIISIDKDLMFGMEDMEGLAPAPITADQISTAQSIAENQDDFDLASLVDLDSSENAPSSLDASVQESEEGLPDDILAALDELADTSSPKKTDQKVDNLPYGIQLYANEVPPVPLEDYVSFEIGTLTGETPSEEIQSPVQETVHETQLIEEDPLASSLTLKADGTPDFEAMSSEYDDFDLDLEEDAMLQALEDLGMTDKKPKKE